MNDVQEPQSANEARDIPEDPTPSAEPASQPNEIAPPLVGLIASIRAAVTRGASAETRAAGAVACRSILAVLEAKPGQPLTATPQRTLLTSPTSPVAALLKQITGAMPARPTTPTTAAPRFHLIEIPSLRRPDGDR